MNMDGIDPYYEEQYEQWKIKEKQAEKDNPYNFSSPIGLGFGKAMEAHKEKCEEYKKTLSPERLKFVEMCDTCANNDRMPLTCIGDQPPGEPKIPYRCNVLWIPRGEGVCEHYVPMKKGGE